MLSNIATSLLTRRGLGIATSHTLGGLIHVVLFCAGVAPLPAIPDGALAVPFAMMTHRE
jgi:hypothetical protein